MVMESVQEDIGDGSNIQYVDHPFNSNTPGGIYAFYLQEKLRKLMILNIELSLIHIAVDDDKRNAILTNIRSFRLRTFAFRQA
ncbi:hypothetical protein LguiB_018783 [Lonicera macranthoides]